MVKEKAFLTDPDQCVFADCLYPDKNVSRVRLLNFSSKDIIYNSQNT